MLLVILAGGSGTRLFPLSRKCYPKQFLKINGRQSLLQQTVRRFAGLISPERIVIVTNQEYVFHVNADLEEIGITAVRVLAEPESRNTAPSIALAMAYCRDELGCSGDEIIFVAPADHYISSPEKFVKLVTEAEKLATERQAIATIGVKAERPDTGYGYIEAGSDGKVRIFHEKPDAATAASYIAQGDCYWNSGMFVFPLAAMEREMAKHAPEIAVIAQKGYKACLTDFASMPEISIDCAVAEKSRNIVVLPLYEGIHWSDVGGFRAIGEMIEADSSGNAVSGDVLIEDCRDTLLIGCDRLITAIGLEGLIVADTPDALLVCRKESGGEVGRIVGELRRRGRHEADENVTMYRPWGCYTVIAEGDGYKVKRIMVKPGQKLSLQLHYHRSEHWTVISGIGLMTLGEKTKYLKENESAYIPATIAHRLENPGAMPLMIIEVQNGRYLGEDDIVRLDDVYGRGNAE